MATTVTVLGKIQPLLTIPEDFTRITSEPRSRNGEAVRVDRYQQRRPVQWFGPHVTLVWGNDDRLLSFNAFTATSSAPLPTQLAARQIAMQVWQALDPSYAAGLDYMRTDRLTRSFEGDNQHVDIPVWWVAMAVITGSQWELEAKWSKWSANPCGITCAAGAQLRSGTMMTGC